MCQKINPSFQTSDSLSYSADVFGAVTEMSTHPRESVTMETCDVSRDNLLRQFSGKRLSLRHFSSVNFVVRDRASIDLNSLKG